MATSDQRRRHAPPLTAITTVIRTAAPALEALDHVMQLLDELLDGTVLVSLKIASASGCIRLFDRVYLHALYSQPVMDAMLREYKLTLALEATIQRGDLEMVKRIYTLHPQRFRMKLHGVTVLRGDLPMLQWLLAHRTDGNCTPEEDDDERIREVPIDMEQVPHCCLLDAYDRACTKKQFHIVRWLYESDAQYRVKRPSWAKLGDDAAETGDLELVQWVFAHMPNSFSQSALDNAARGGHLDVVQFLAENRKERWADSAVYYALFNGHDHVAQYLRAQELVIETPKPKSLLLDAFAAGRDDLLESDWFLSLVQWYAKKSKATLNIAMTTSCEFGQLEMAQWLVELYKLSWQKDALLKAASNGHLPILEWAHNTNACTTWGGRVMQKASENGHLAIVEWLHRNRTESCGTTAMDLAARFGHLEVVQWLHENRTEGCTTSAMDRASARGHLHVVQWLHGNRQEGCTHVAMDHAASNGHLRVVQWLHANRMEGCTTNAMDDAAIKGRLEMVMWLHTHRTEGCTTKAMDSGSFLVVQWLHSHRHEGCDPTAAIEDALKRGSFVKLKFVLENYVDQCSSHLGGQVAATGHLPMLQWLDSSYPQTVDRKSLRRIAFFGRHDHIISWLDSLVRNK